MWRVSGWKKFFKNYFLTSFHKKNHLSLSYMVVELKNLFLKITLCIFTGDGTRYLFKNHWRGFLCTLKMMLYPWYLWMWPNWRTDDQVKMRSKVGSILYGYVLTRGNLDSDIDGHTGMMIWRHKQNIIYKPKLEATRS